MERKRNLTETFCVVRREDGYEERFLSAKSAARACGVGEDTVMRSARTDGDVKVAGVTLRFRIVPARYRVVVKATGQELICGWDAERKVFVTGGGGVWMKKSQVSSYEEVHDGDV